MEWPAYLRTQLTKSREFRIRCTTGLDRRFPEYGIDRLWEALQPVAHGNQNVAHTTRSFRSLTIRSRNLAPSVCPIQRPSTSRVPSRRTPSAKYIALLRTAPSFRIFTRSASKNTTGYMNSSGLCCHSHALSITASVTRTDEVQRCDTSRRYISSRKP